MADTTISSLPKGTPSGNHLLPYSTGSSTLGVPVSAIFQNAISVGIGTGSNTNKGLMVRTGYAESLSYGGPVPLVLSGADNNSFIAFHVDLDNKKQTCLTDSNGARTLVFDNSTIGATNLQLWNNNVETIRIIANGNVGIGTTTPTSKLHVNGDATVTGNIITPNRTAFNAICSSPNLITGRVRYSFIGLNINNALNGNTGMFTAPVAGVYFFSFNGFRQAGVADTQISFFLNDVGTSIRNYSSGNSSIGYTALGIAGCFNLNINDTVYVNVDIGFLHNNASGTFAGYFVG